MAARHLLSLLGLLTLPLVGCDQDAAPAENAGETPANLEDQPVGDVVDDSGKADGDWGSALTCKQAPDLPSLANPRIVLSVEGRYVRLIDESAGFDRVYPAGVGAIDTDAGSRTFGESLSYFPVVATRSHDFAITPSSIQPCKTYQSSSGVPLFAGLPFLSFYGNYGLHGPIDNFRRPDGGTLRNGFVSHGCFRMQGADVLEVYARIKGVARVPVTMIREAELATSGGRVGLEQKWIGAACGTDADCAGMNNGTCRVNPYTGTGFCTATCERFCDDNPLHPATLCTPDPSDPATGICVPRVVSWDAECRALDHFTPQTTTRFGDPTYTAQACLPGTKGFVGDGCLSDGDCDGGATCNQGESGRGVCTVPCTRYCTDAPGKPSTFCVSDGGDAGQCVRICDPGLGAPECLSGQDCVEEARFGQPGVTRHVCR